MSFCSDWILRVICYFLECQKLGCFTFLHTIVYLIKIIYIVFIHKFKQIIDLNNLNGNKGAWINKAPSLNEVWEFQLTPVGIWGGWVSNDMRGGGWFSMGLCNGTMGLVMGANLDPLAFIPFSMISLILPTATNKVS